MSNPFAETYARMNANRNSWTGTDKSPPSAEQTQIVETAPTNAIPEFTINEHGFVRRADPSVATASMNTQQHRSMKQSIRDVTGLSEARGMPCPRQHPQSLIEASVAALSRANRSPFPGSQEVIAEEDASKTRENKMMKHNDASLADMARTTAKILRGRRGSKTITPNKVGAYAPARSGDQRKFANLHQVQRHDNPSNGDSLYQGATKPYDRKKNRFGYNNHDDEKAEFAADKSKQKQMIAAMAEEAASIVETTAQAAARMAKQLSDRYGCAHFIHSYDHPDVPGKKLFGVVSQRHHSNDPDRDFKFHLTHIVHPTPPKPYKPIKEATDANGRKLRDNLTQDEKDRVAKYGSVVNFKSAGARKKPVKEPRQETVAETVARRQEEARGRQRGRYLKMAYGTEKELRDKIVGEGCVRKPVELVTEQDLRDVMNDRLPRILREEASAATPTLLIDSWNHPISGLTE